MTDRSFEIVLSKRATNVWASRALSLPGVRLLSVVDSGGSSLPYALRDDATVTATSSAPTLVARIELLEDLVTQSVVDQAKLDLDRQRLAAEERAGRRTLWFGLATAVLSALVTVGVAMLTHAGGAQSPAPAPRVYQDLVECRESLNVLATLSQAGEQTLGSLREAVSRSIDSCQGRLNAAIATSSG